MSHYPRKDSFYTIRTNILQKPIGVMFSFETIVRILIGRIA